MPESSLSLVIPNAMPDVCAAPVESSERQVHFGRVLCALYVFSFMDAEFLLAPEVFFFIS